MNLVVSTSALMMFILNLEQKDVLLLIVFGLGLCFAAAAVMSEEAAQYRSSTDENETEGQWTKIV